MSAEAPDSLEDQRPPQGPPESLRIEMRRQAPPEVVHRAIDLQRADAQKRLDALPAKAHVDGAPEVGKLNRQLRTLDAAQRVLTPWVNRPDGGLKSGVNSFGDYAKLRLQGTLAEHELFDMSERQYSRLSEADRLRLMSEPAYIDKMEEQQANLTEQERLDLPEVEHMVETADWQHALDRAFGWGPVGPEGPTPPQPADRGPEPPPAPAAPDATDVLDRQEAQQERVSQARGRFHRIFSRGGKESAGAGPEAPPPAQRPAPNQPQSTPEDPSSWRLPDRPPPRQRRQAPPPSYYSPPERTRLDWPGDPPPAPKRPAAPQRPASPEPQAAPPPAEHQGWGPPPPPQPEQPAAPPQPPERAPEPMRAAWPFPPEEPAPAERPAPPSPAERPLPEPASSLTEAPASPEPLPRGERARDGVETIAPKQLIGQIVDDARGRTYINANMERGANMKAGDGSEQDLRAIARRVVMNSNLSETENGQEWVAPTWSRTPMETVAFTPVMTADYKTVQTPRETRRGILGSRLGRQEVVVTHEVVVGNERAALITNPRTGEQEPAILFQYHFGGEAGANPGGTVGYIEYTGGVESERDGIDFAVGLELPLSVARQLELAIVSDPKVARDLVEKLAIERSQGQITKEKWRDGDPHFKHPIRPPWEKLPRGPRGWKILLATIDSPDPRHPPFGVDTERHQGDALQTHGDRMYRYRTRRLPVAA